MMPADTAHTDPLWHEDGTPLVRVRQITLAQLRELGIAQLVYLREGTVDGETAYAIHAADGSAVAVVEDIEVAIELVAEHGLTFATVH
jgi:hypothetical protein